MLSSEQKNIIIETLKPFNPKFIGLFGSYARNEETEKSDIDLLLELNYPTLSLFDIGGLYSSLEDKLNRKIDIVFKNKIKRQLEPFIAKDLVTLYKD